VPRRVRARRWRPARTWPPASAASSGNLITSWSLTDHPATYLPYSNLQQAMKQTIRPDFHCFSFNVIDLE